MNLKNQNLNAHREWISKLNFIHEECMYYRNKISHLLSLIVDDNMHQKAKSYRQNITNFLKDLDSFKRKLKSSHSVPYESAEVSSSKEKMEKMIDQYIFLKEDFSMLRTSLSRSKNLTAA